LPRCAAPLAAVGDPDAPKSKQPNEPVDLPFARSVLMVFGVGIGLLH
jgi:hypothetical protein